MNPLRLCLCCLWAVVATTVQAEELCSVKNAEAVWDSSYLSLHGFFGVPLEPPAIVFLPGSSKLQSVGEVTTFGYYNRNSKTLHILCDEKSAKWLEIAVRHEATHYYLDHAFGPLPIWLNEGLATYMEAGTFDDAHRHHNINRPRLQEFIGMLKWNKVPPLLAILSLDPYSKTASEYYAAYWALLFALIHDEDEALQKQRREWLKGLLKDAERDPEAINRQLISALQKESPNLADWELRWHRALWDLR